ncbi:MAG: SGNH/GDSL hydrolase family protein [Oscillospiraceae bacterium]|nr:SGNH/GDSL hydrolase family protein [Oscillospiraceae bacterium]
MNIIKSLKNFSMTAALIATMLMLSGCGAQETGLETGTENITLENLENTLETTSGETAKQPETEEEFHAAMVERSLYSLGNTKRLKEKFQKARDGEEVTIAYIGGSITEGIGGGNDGCYAKLSADMFAEKFGTEKFGTEKFGNVNYINAGLSGTPSNLGVLRLQRDVLDNSPDIIFVEFAVNDGQDKIAKESYESLVKTALEAESEPAVILLFNVIESGYTAQEHMKQIGTFYDLPMISAADALTPEFEEGRMTWQDYSGDQSHPNKFGHGLLCEFIEYLYDKADAADAPAAYEVKPGEVFGSPYANARLLTPLYGEDCVDCVGGNVAVKDTGAFAMGNGSSSGFTGCWQYGGGDEPMKIHVSGSSFFVIYKRDNKEERGAFDVYLNGEKLTTVNTNQKDGWGEAFSQQIIKFQTSKEMDFEIRPAEGSEDKTIEILGFAAAGKE